jgi:outer membrane lipoprotein-sorting protein
LPGSLLAQQLAVRSELGHLPVAVLPIPGLGSGALPAGNRPSGCAGRTAKGGNMLKKAVLLTLSGILLAGPAAAQQASLQDILNNYYGAVGGLDAWKNVKSMKATGKRMMGPGMDAPFVMMAKRPDKIRVEFTVQGMTGIMAYDGETAWMVMPFMGKTEPEVMPDFMAKEIKMESDLDGPLMGYEDEGHQLELVGKEDADGTEAYKVKVTLKSGDVQYYFLDAEHYVPIKITGSRDMQGNVVNYEITLSDYKDVGGLMMAHSISSKATGMPAQDVITIERVELNTTIDDASFSMPKAAAESKK